MTKIYLFLASLFFMTACQQQKNEEPFIEEMTQEMPTNNIQPVLANDLNALKSNFEQKASDEKKKAYAAGIQFIRDNQIIENATQVGDTAVDFTLTNAANQEVSLYKELEKGPVVLLWYRGGWCPYCNITLHYMQEALPLFQEYNANLLALTPELPDSSLATAEKHALEFEVLSDIDNKIAQQYKVVFELTDEVAALYEKGFGLSSYNGNNKGELPLAATYIIGTDRIVKYAFLDADYRNRAEPQDILDVLKEL